MGKKSEAELRQMHWRDRYEYEAGLEGEQLKKLDELALLRRIESNGLGSYFGIWRAIGRVGTVERAALVLWDFLRRSPGKPMMLHRYHCAAALFNIIGMPDPASENDLRKRVQWDHYGEEARQEALLELKGIIEEKILARS